MNQLTGLAFLERWLPSTRYDFMSSVPHGGYGTSAKLGLQSVLVAANSPPTRRIARAHLTSEHVGLMIFNAGMVGTADDHLPRQ